MNEVRINKAKKAIIEGTGVNGYALPFLTPRPSEPHWTCPVWFFIGEALNTNQIKKGNE
mgnify:CR=1 FL=1|jgi:hypothetical protein|tara:strand:- start:1321 stop:1497 length:177 start_codon:yes stop_codon:yes gene_type:complete